MVLERISRNLVDDPSVLWRMTGPIDHWLTTFSTGAWGLCQDDGGGWESLLDGDVVMLHATEPTQPYLDRLAEQGVSAEGLVGASCYIGLGVVAARSQKGTVPVWLGEFLGETCCPLLVEFDPIVWFGDTALISPGISFEERVHFDAETREFDAAAVRDDLLGLLSHSWTLESVREATGSTPSAMGRIGRFRNEGLRRYVALRAADVLRAQDEGRSLLALEEMQQDFQRAVERAEGLPPEELEARAVAGGSPEPRRQTANASTFLRDPYVTAWTIVKAEGICDLCQQPAPFEDRHGKPYLELHYVEPLSRGGSDTVDNAVALCPNCHARMHLLDADEDKDRLAARCAE
jgi:hypothetical protein